MAYTGAATVLMHDGRTEFHVVEQGLLHLSDGYNHSSQVLAPAKARRLCWHSTNGACSSRLDNAGLDVGGLGRGEACRPWAPPSWVWEKPDDGAITSAFAL